MKRIFGFLYLLFFFIGLGISLATEVEEISGLLDLATEFNRKDDSKMYSLADSAENILISQKKINDQYFRASYLKSRVMVRKGNDLEAINYLENALQKKEELSEYIGQNHFILGLAYRHVSNREKTVYHYNTAIQIFDSLDICLPFVKAKNNLGNFYNAISSFELALENYTDALEKIDSCPDNYLQAILQRNIAGVYFNYYRDLDKGELYFKNSIESFSRLDTSNNKIIKSLAGSKISLAYLLSEKGNYDESLKIFQNCKNKADKHKLVIRQIESSAGIANIYRLYKKYTLSEQYYLEAVETAKSKSYNYLLSGLYTGLGKLYLDRKMYSYALNSLEEGYAISSTNNYLQEKAEILFLQSEAYKAQKKYALANQKIESYAKLKDEIFNNDNNRKIEARKADIDLIRKDQEIEILRLEKEKNKAIEQAITSDLKIKNLMIFGLSGITILCIIMAFFILKNRTKRAKITELELESEKEKLKHKLQINQKLSEIKLFKTAIESKKEEQERISRDLHDNIGATLAAIKLSLNNQTTKREEILPFLDNVYNHVRDLSHNLSKISQEQVDFKMILKSYVDRIAEISDMEIHFEILPEDALNSLKDQCQAELFSILREGLNNTLKHAESKSVEIVFSKENDWINLYIEDHGKGFDVDKETEGIGLFNIRSRVELLGGKFELDARKDRGVILNISIPCKL
jgi:signal transduction histidine kinase